MTKLKSPITITIETVRQAVCVWHRLNIGISGNQKITRIPEWALSDINADAQDAWLAVDAALRKAGIDPNEQPPQPLLILGEPATANADGSVNMLRGVVPRATLEAVLKLSSEAMAGVWPKYYQWGTCIIRLDDATGFGAWECSCVNERVSTCWNLEAVTKESSFKPLTPQQAAEILEGKR